MLHELNQHTHTYFIYLFQQNICSQSTSVQSIPRATHHVQRKCYKYNNEIVEQGQEHIHIKSK